MRLSMRLTKLFSLLTGAYLLSVVPTMPVQAQESGPVSVQRHERLITKAKMREIRRASR